MTNLNLGSRREKFAASVAKGWSLTEAAKRAGYSSHSARSTGCKLYKQSAIKDRVEQLREVELLSRRDAAQEQAKAVVLVQAIAALLEGFHQSANQGL